MNRWTVGMVVVLVSCLLFLITGVFSQTGSDRSAAFSTPLEALEAVREEPQDPAIPASQQEEDAAGEGEITTVSTQLALEDSESADYATVFPGVTVQRIDFAIASEDWASMIAELSSAGIGTTGGRVPTRPSNDRGVPGNTNPVVGEAAMAVDETFDASLSYVPCTVRFEGQVWNDVGIRFKGNSTLRTAATSGSLKYPFHLDFDEFEDTNPAVLNQRFFGFDDLSLGNMSMDASYVRQYVAAEIFRSFGVPMPEVAFYQVTLDIGSGEQFLGLYTVTETPDDAFLDTYFGSSSGNLYKPQGGSANWATFDKEDFEKKSNEDAADWSDIEAVFEALQASQTDAADWRAGLESVFDVDGFLRWLAINRLIANWDSYGQMPQNYYLYTSPDGVVHWIPWDLNESFSSRNNSSTSIDLSGIGDSWPLISTVISDPVYKAAYDAYVLEALESVFSLDAVETLVRETFDAIAPFLMDESGNVSKYSFSGTVADSRVAMEAVVRMATSQFVKASNYLVANDAEPANIVITEIHYNPSPDQGADEEYEFLELCNLGETLIDLSGWQLDDGVVCSVPEGTLLQPSEVLVIAANADFYAHLNCEVLQWESGKLSNGGETVRLVDEDGFWIDCVTYNDEGIWSGEPDGNGPSLELADVDSPNHVPSNWEASETVGGTPGR